MKAARPEYPVAAGKYYCPNTAHSKRSKAGFVRDKPTIPVIVHSSESQLLTTSLYGAHMPANNYKVRNVSKWLCGARTSGSVDTGPAAPLHRYIKYLAPILKKSPRNRPPILGADCGKRRVLLMKQELYIRRIPYGCYGGR